MLYALAMPSSSSPCGDGARNAKRVLGKKVCAQEGPSNFDLAQFCQKKRKIEKEEKQTLLSFVRERRRTRGDKLCAQERLDPTLALLNSATTGTASYINTAIILQFWQNHSHHFINQTIYTQFNPTIADAKIFHDNLKLPNWYEKGGWPTKMYSDP